MAVRSNRISEAATSEEESWRWALWAVFAVTVARLVWLAGGNSDLYPDEAQYWVWSLHPAFGYYSKPPLVAWLIRLTTTIFGEDELAVRLAAPLLHFGTSLVLYRVARRLYDARVALWSAIAYATLPGVSASAVIISTDAPLLFCWSVALHGFVRARESDGGRWWWLVGIAAGLGLLAKYAMAYWLISALIYLLIFRDERRHLPRFLAAAGLAFVIYVPNLAWNAAHGFVSYRHTRDNANLHGALVHPQQFLEFFASQFGVFGPLFFGALLLITLTAARSLKDRRAALLACFALPTLAMMLVVSFLSRAQPNWSAPTFVSAVVLVVAWLFDRGARARQVAAAALALMGAAMLAWAAALFAVSRNDMAGLAAALAVLAVIAFLLAFLVLRQRIGIVAGAVALNLAFAVILFGAHDAAAAMGSPLPAKYDPLHRLQGWKRLGRVVSLQLAQHPGAILMADDREEMAALLYYVRPYPADALKWNGEGGIHDGFDLTAEPQRYIGQDFLLVSQSPDNVARILSRFDKADPPIHLVIPLDRHTSRSYEIYWLHGFKGYRSSAASPDPR